MKKNEIRDICLVIKIMAFVIWSAPIVVFGTVGVWGIVPTFFGVSMAAMLMKLGVEMIPEIKVQSPAWANLYQTFPKLIFGYMVTTWVIGWGFNDWTWRSLLALVVGYMIACRFVTWFVQHLSSSLRKSEEQFPPAAVTDDTRGTW